jgi:hypothetical protein
MARFVPFLLVFIWTTGLSASQPQPVVELALRERLNTAVTDAQAAIAAVDVKKVAVEPKSGARIDASSERTRQSLHLIRTAAEFARQNPSSPSAQLILLLQLDGYQAQVDSVAVNLESAIVRSPVAAVDQLSAWADAMDQALDALHKVRLELETAVTAMVTDAERRLRDCGK